MVEQVESLRDFEDSGSDPSQARWKAELKVARDYYKDYLDKCRKIIKSYRDDRDKNEGVVTDLRRVNLLWSNTQTLKPAVLAKKPKAVVTRRNNDSDAISLIASQTLERCIDYVIDDDDFDYSLFQARDDYLLLSRGLVWPVFTADVDEATQTASNENVLCDYVLYSDFLQSPARSETEVRWKARKHYLNRDQLVERFGEEIGNAIPLTYTDEAAKKSVKEDHDLELFKQAEIWEIWCITDKKIYWICESYDQVCDTKDDYLGLTKFFPCPRPAYGVMTNNTLVPVPEYDLYRDQARAIDEYETRIQSLRDAMRVRGFYNSEFEDLQRLYNEAGENDLIPVNDWGAFQGKGGTEGNIVFAPLKEIVAAVIELTNAIEQEKQRIYEITGISDIIRGATNPKETATAQQLKGQFGNLRLEDKRREINRFAKGVIETIGEIISEHYSTKTIMEMAGLQVVPMPPAMADPMGQPAPRPPLVYPKVYEDEWLKAAELLRNDLLRKFRIEIETDSTIVADEQSEKEAASEMIMAVGGLLQQSLPVVTAAPPLIPVISEILLWSLRKFRVGRSLEGVVEQAAEQMGAMALAPPQNPEMTRVENDAKAKEKEQELKRYEIDKGAETSREIETMRGKNNLANTKLGQVNQLTTDVDEEGNEIPSQLMQQLGQVAMGQQQMMQVMMQLLQVMAAPRKTTLIRDETQTATGAISEIVMPNQQVH